MRGQIIYRRRSLQVKDYSTLRYKNITPTDIDGFFEIQGKVFVFIELKVVDIELPHGQTLALERLADNINKPCIIIIADHNVPIDTDIDVANCKVRQYRYQGKWYNIIGRTVHDVIDSFLRRAGLVDYISSDK